MLIRAGPVKTLRPQSWLFRAPVATMPLRAKITNPGMTRNMASYADEMKPNPDDPPSDVLFGTKFGLRTIELNRPEKLNSLSGSMIRKIVPRLQEWKKSQMANVVVIKGAGRALCAGGDVVVLAKLNQEGAEGQEKSKAYFASEYRLDHMIATYPKPYVAFMDGITMGGGVGLSIHARFRIATEKTVFAMPETTIGFFPDVGASFFLPRMDGQVGTYLALTSDQLKGVNVFYAGVATHYIDSSSLPDLEARLSELDFKDYTSPEDRLDIIDDTIEEFTTGLPHDVPMQIAGDIRQAIDYCFQRHFSAEQILSHLKTIGDDQKAPEKVREWAAKTHKTILSRSPTSVKVTLKQMRDGRDWDILKTFQHEHHIASKFMEHPDFVEGVTARLQSKPPRTPSWTPGSLDAVTEETVNSFFTASPTLNGFEMGPDAAFADYPHEWIGLPREHDIASLVQSGQYESKEHLVNHVLEVRKGKMGVKEKVEEVLNRKTKESGGRLQWIE